MRARHRNVVLLLLGFSAASSAGLAACASDSTEREAFDAPDAQPDTRAVLPEAAADAVTADVVDARVPFDPTEEKVVCTGAPAARCAVEIVAGSKHFCARMGDGTVRCWGSSDFGALGGGDQGGGPEVARLAASLKPDPDAGVADAEAGADAGDGKDAGTEAGADAGAVDAGVPTHTVTVLGVRGATQLSASASTTCARLDDGRVLCWGNNEYGQLGLPAGKGGAATFDPFPHPTPSEVALPGPALRVDVGDNSACAVLASGAVWCWGNDEQGQLARDGVTSAYVLAPGAASLGSIGALRIFPGTSTLLALTSSGGVVSWGAVGGNPGLLCGRMSSISPDVVPSPIAELAPVSSLAVTASLYANEGDPPSLAPGLGPIPPGGGPVRHAHACAIVAGQVRCWGRSDRGALCTGFPDTEVVPAFAPVGSSAWPQQVAVGDEITCARLTDGTIQCCGDDTRGRLGTGTVGLYSALFTPASAFHEHAVAVAASHRAVCALVQGGAVSCWGSNGHGELGTESPDTSDHPTPLAVAF